MDFVVIGIVIGGIIVLAGVAIRDLGPRMKPWIPRDIPSDVTPQRLTTAWNRYCVASGSLITTGGLLMVLATVGAIVFEASDSIGLDAVLATGILALAAIALAAFVVTPHYRRGGFDGRVAADFREGARQIPAPERQAIAEPDDVFALAEVDADELRPPTAEPAPSPIDGETELPGTMATHVRVVEPASSTELASEEPATVSEVEAGVGGEAAPAELIRPALGPGFEDNLDEPSVAFEPWVASEPEPIPESRDRYERHAGRRQVSPPAVRTQFPTIDDDLPAWNTPTEPEIQPSVGLQGPAESAPTIVRGESAGKEGFQSNLLADLETPDSEPLEAPGAFKSRLLNELTASAAPASPEPAAADDDAEPVADILLDEFSLPEPPASGSRGSNGGR